MVTSQLISSISLRKRRKALSLFCFFFLMCYMTSSFYNERGKFPSEEFNQNLNSKLFIPPISLNKTIDIDDKNSLEKLNKKYCGQSKCKFLFLYSNGEQETKANLHFRSFTQLAESLNRTMVLTNIGNSRIGTCNKFSFDFYYNVNLLQKDFPYVKFISEKKFISWLKERDQIKKKVNRKDDKVISPLSILHSNIVVIRKSIANKTSYNYVKPDVKKLNQGCLFKFEPWMNLTDPKNSKVKYTKMIIARQDLATVESRVKFSNYLVNTLTIKEEILLINGYVEYALFPKVTPAIPYSNYILNEAQKIKDKLSSSYIGIHWRLEQSTPELLPKCVQGLIQTLNDIMKKEGIKNIYLATDYPLLSSKSQSSTFRKINHYHHDAIRTLNETFKLDTWVSLKGLEQLRKDEKYHSEITGAGIQGILDKLVCINSNYFISGPKGCSRISSTFTKAIVLERRNRIIDHDLLNVLNVVDNWKVKV